MGNSCCNPGNDKESELIQNNIKGSKTEKKSKSGKGKLSESETRDFTESRNEKIHSENSKDVIKISKGFFVLNKDTKFKDDYDLKETLGEGAFGVVGKCQNKDSKAIRAVKMLNKQKLSKDEVADIANEIEIIKELDHPNIVKVYETYEDHKYLYIVTELVEGGELFDELTKRRKFTETD